MSCWLSTIPILLLCLNNVISDGCGQYSPIMQMVNFGNRSRLGDWPWHTAVMHLNNRSSPRYVCGGTLIASNFILTAAHCMYGESRRLEASEIVTRIGVTHFQRTENSQQEKPVAKIIVHEDFKSTTSESDIALLKLIGNFQITTYVKPICLWRHSKNEKIIVDNKLGYVVGWGKNEKSFSADQLEHTVMRIASAKECKNSDPFHYSQFLVEDRCLCAGFQNNASVGYGDSGGGLYIEFDGRWILRGVLSNGKYNLTTEKLDTSSFVVFSNVGFFLPWIDKMTEVDRQMTEVDTIKSCGHRNKEGVNPENSESQFGEFPWVVAILEEGRDKYFGGSLINPGVVLTTAHCIKSFKWRPQNLIIRAGEWNMGSTREPIGYEERRVEKIKSHPGFRSTSLVNNIALLFLEDNFDLSQTINTICLPPQGFTIDNGRVTATGWVRTSKDDSKQILKSFDLEYLQRAECERNLQNLIGNRSFKLDKSFICAGGEPGVDACKGDAGSPIIYAIPDDFDERYYAVGMVSCNAGCDPPGIPTAYTDIGQFRDWIDEQLEAEDIQNHDYQYQKQSSETD